jgi:hypothetical protein
MMTVTVGVTVGGKLVRVGGTLVCVGGGIDGGLSVAKGDGVFTTAAKAAETIDVLIDRRINNTPSPKAMTRTKGLVTEGETSATKILNLPPTRAIKIRTAPSTKKPIPKLSGIIHSSSFCIFLLVAFVLIFLFL